MDTVTKNQINTIAKLIHHTFNIPLATCINSLTNLVGMHSKEEVEKGYDIRVRRTLPEVVDEILEVIPKSEQSLRLQLESMASSLRTVSPEMVRWWWDELARILTIEIGEPIDEWELEVEKIFNGD